LSAHYNSILDEETRSSALDALAKQMAFNGTDEALDWANSLSSPEDQDLAHDTIYRETPRGIGAVLKVESGFPMVLEALVPNGLEAGDLIVSALNNGTDLTEFYGSDIMNSIEALRGTPGTDVVIQVMRPDPDTGEYTQVEITVTRQQLWLEEEDQP
jgi:C-terminal processing protease CtpA/Prc